MELKTKYICLAYFLLYDWWLGVRGLQLTLPEAIHDLYTICG